MGGQEAPEYSIAKADLLGPKIDLHHLEGTATDAVHLTRYSNAAVIINLISKLKAIDTVFMVIDTVSIDTVSKFINSKTVS